MSKWYAFIWRELRFHGVYIATGYNNVDEAILKIFEASGHSPNEYRKDFEGIKKASENHPIISMSTDGEIIDIPLWFVVSESEVDEMIKGLSSRNFPVMVRR